MASADDKKALIRKARKGKVEGDDGFRVKLNELVKAGITGPGHDYGLDYSCEPYWRSALWEATWKNHEAVVKLLVEKNASIDYGDYEGRTPLHEAAYYGYKNLVDFLIEKGHPVDSVDKYGQTPLFRAAEAGRDEVVELLMSKGAKPNLLDSDGATAQHVASFGGEPMMSNWLLYHGSWKNRYSVQEDGPPVVEIPTPLTRDKKNEEAKEEGGDAAAEEEPGSPDSPPADQPED